MLKYYGNLYSGTKEDLDAILEVLEPEGFQLAYQGEFGGTLVKEVPDPNETEE